MKFKTIREYYKDWIIVAREINKTGEKKWLVAIDKQRFYGKHARFAIAQAREYIDKYDILAG